MLTQIILASTSETILCVCYTNHALDDFLEGLLDVGLRDIVRVGGRSKNERLAEFNLREKAKDGNVQFSREQKRRYAQLKGTIEETVKEVDSIQKVCRREIGRGWWKTVAPYLKQYHLDAWEQLQVSCLADNEGFKVAGVDSEDYLWKRWIGGKKACVPFEDRNELSLWSLSKQERALKKLEWQHEMYEEHRLELDGALKTIKRAKDELKQLQDSTDSVILSQARIIACTTTKAAMCKHLLDDASAGVVLVEEAAEIFESHILTSLSKNTKRLVMIGDHKQLRPKAQHYPLTVESNRQYDLNRSLFERLAAVLPTSLLGIQHRMHPLISAIPRLTTYPELHDAPSTLDRPKVHGLQSRLIFIDHDHSEDFHSTQTERVDAISKTNQHEVELVVACVRYLFQQGYMPQNLVVLTPYLGQLLKIQKALSSTWNVFIDDMDFNEAKSFLQGIEGFEAARNMGPVDSSVRVATIDNYQGEEADIVIASLVRGNADHNIGFLREPERVNVLLSRARVCELIIGNRATLEGARGSNAPLRGGQLWRKILGHLDSCGNVFCGLPVICQSHSKEAVLHTAKEIAENCPDGGCLQRCAQLLECGHPCTKQCHVGPCVKCSVLCRDKCPRGHSIVRECSDGPPKCQHTISWKCPLGHALSGVCFKGKDSSECAGCQSLRDKEEEQFFVEQKLQEALDRKHGQLEASRDELQAALRENIHRQQLGMIEEEIALVERQLEETQQKDTSRSLGQAGETSFKSELDDMVCTLLRESDSKTLFASEIADLYRERQGKDLQLDANHNIGKADGTPMGYRAIFESLACCEIVPPSKLGKKKHMKKGLKVRLLEKQDSRVRPKTARGDDTIDKSVATKRPRFDYEAPAPDFCMEDPTQKLEDGMPLSHERDSGIVANEHVKAQAPAAKDVDVASLEGRASGMDAESLPEEQFDIYAAVTDIVKRFTDEGALAADNILDEMKALPSFRATSEIQALDYIIGEELDPSGNPSRPPPKSEIESSLCRVVCFYSYSLYCSLNGYPLQAQQFAAKVLANANDSDLQLPKSWLERAELLNQIPSIEAKMQPSKDEDKPEDKWSLVLTSDSKAPAVMGDSVLPMIGLTSVKNSMVGMYHRIKLAQEQNDGVAASYNIRFEGNPGTG